MPEEFINSNVSKGVQQNVRSYLIEPREKEVFDRPTAAAGAATNGT